MKGLSFILLFLACVAYKSAYTQDTTAIWENAFVPNMFSPNGDGKNEEFKVYGKGFQTLELRIYNRWAEIVYQSNNLEEITEIGWDGKTGGKQQPVGTYMWVVTGTFISGKEVSVEGKNTGSLLMIQ